MKTSELTGAALDWAVAKCESKDYEARNTYDGIGMLYEATNYSTNWAQSGPIIERYCIQVERGCDAYVAYTNKYWWQEEDGGTEHRDETKEQGGDYLEAAMRCYVASKLGDEVEIPEELK